MMMIFVCNLALHYFPVVVLCRFISHHSMFVCLLHSICQPAIQCAIHLCPVFVHFASNSIGCYSIYEDDYGRSDRINILSAVFTSLIVLCVFFFFTSNISLHKMMIMTYHINTCGPPIAVRTIRIYTRYVDPHFLTKALMHFIKCAIELVWWLH